MIVDHEKIHGTPPPVAGWKEMQTETGTQRSKIQRVWLSRPYKRSSILSTRGFDPHDQARKPAGAKQTGLRRLGTRTKGQALLRGRFRRKERCRIGTSCYQPPIARAPT